MIRQRALYPSSLLRGVLSPDSARAQHASLASGSDTDSAVLCDALLPWVDAHRWWMFAAMLLTYIAGFNGQWRIQPDAALYLSIGRNLAEGKGFTYLGEPNHLAYPGWPALIAGVMKLFGQSLLAVNLTATLIALLTVAMVYRLFLLHSGRPTAVVVAVGVGFTKAFYCYGFELWADMLFAFGAMAFLAGYEGIVNSPGRKGGDGMAGGAVRRSKSISRFMSAGWLDSIFLVGGLFIALMTRPTAWPLLLAWGLALPMDAWRGRIRWRSVGVLYAMVCAVGATLLLGRHQWGDQYARYLLVQLHGSGRHTLWPLVAKNLSSLLTWAASDVLFQVRLGWFCNGLLSVIVLLLGFGLFRYRSVWGFWFCLLLGTILLSQETLDRYFLPVLPLLVFAWWDALVRVNRLLARRWDGMGANLAFVFLLGFGMVMNFTKVCGIIAQQHSRPFLSHYDQGRYEIIPEFSSKLAEQVPSDGIVLIRAPYGRVTAFLSRRMVKGFADVAPSAAGSRPIYVVEPLDEGTSQFLHEAHLREGPALFTVSPSAQCGSGGVTMSLRATQLKSQ
jgi:hypothetical protein